MKKNVLFVCAAGYLAGCLLFIYAFPSWNPVLYFVSIGLYTGSAGLLTWLYTEKKTLLKALICGFGFYAAFYCVTFVFTNMYDPQTGKEASFTATFSGAKAITVYRNGEKTEIAGETLNLTLENREGIFLTVSF